MADLHALITALSAGDAHEALRRMGVAKLGPRQKLAALVTPYWRALGLKEKANALYHASRFEEAAAQAPSRPISPDLASRRHPAPPWPGGFTVSPGRPSS